jgi:hypothetical protein
MWVAATELPTAASHPFYARLNRMLADQGFDEFVEQACASFYAETIHWAAATTSHRGPFGATDAWDGRNSHTSMA